MIAPRILLPRRRLIDYIRAQKCSTGGGVQRRCRIQTTNVRPSIIISSSRGFSDEYHDDKDSSSQPILAITGNSPGLPTVFLFPTSPARQQKEQHISRSKIAAGKGAFRFAVKRCASSHHRIHGTTNDCDILPSICAKPHTLEYGQEALLITPELACALVRSCGMFYLSSIGILRHRMCKKRKPPGRSFADACPNEGNNRVYLHRLQ